MQKGILLVNLGTPDAPTPAAVGKYLSEFLMDPRVIDIPFLLRWLLVNRTIVPRRRFDSASLYEKIWTDRGSPLLYHSVDLTEKVANILGPTYAVQLAMRYGNPSFEQAAATFKSRGVEEVLVYPLYPQYSLAATESSIDWAKKHLSEFKLTFVPPFYDDEEYLNAVADVSRKSLDAINPDKVLFSFHGLPARHVRKTDPSRNHCLKTNICCASMISVNCDCYRAQCYATARGVAAKLGIAEKDYLVAFQSRLNQRWIRPYSDEMYQLLPKQGVKRLAVVCPSFVADCLETLEEVAIRGNEEFQKHGGERISLVPSLNSSDVWAQAVARRAARGA